ncbi:hypothetical protein [Bacillus sp. NEAU-Y102]
MKKKKYLMLARRTDGLYTYIGEKVVTIIGCFGLRAEIKKTFIQNGCKWFLVLNPQGSGKYLVCHENGFSLAFGNTQKEAIAKAKDVLEQKGDRLVAGVKAAQKYTEQIKISVLSM